MAGIESGTKPDRERLLNERDTQVMIFDAKAEQKKITLPPFTPYDAAIALYYFSDNESSVLAKYQVPLPDTDTLKKADMVIDSFLDNLKDPVEVKGLANRTRLEAFSALEKFATSPEMIAAWEEKQNETGATKDTVDLIVMRQAISLARTLQLKAEEARKAEREKEVKKTEKGDKQESEKKVTPIKDIYNQIYAKFGSNMKIQDGHGNRGSH